MAYRVDVSARAARDFDLLYRRPRSAGHDGAAWLDGLETAILSLSNTPERCAPTPEDHRLRHLPFGSRRDIYCRIFKADRAAQVVTVLAIRQGAREPI